MRPCAVAHARIHSIVLCSAAISFSSFFFCLSYAHPYLLSDNRHYMFYVWKNFYRRFDPTFKYAMIPVYVTCGALMQCGWSSAQSKSRLFQLSYWLSVCLCLMPTPLVEPRYFIFPTCMWMLHAAPTLCSSLRRTTLTIILYVLINALTLFIFIHRPFRAPDGSIGRFMW